MHGNKILIVQFLICTVIIYFGCIVAANYCALLLDYDAQLGEGVMVVAGYPVFGALDYFTWMYYYRAYYPSVFDAADRIIYTSVGVSFIAAIVGSLYRNREPQDRATYGSAQWATQQDLVGMGLLGDEGIILGKTDRGHYLRHDGPEHTLLVAPPRSGKGVGTVVPTLLTWAHSVICNDIKEELWQTTAGYRSTFSHAIYFNPTSLSSAGFNPLMEVRRGPHEVKDVQNIADILVDPEGARDRRDHWEKTAHALLVGAILHVLYAETRKTLPGVTSFLSSPESDFEGTLTKMMGTLHLGDKPHPVVAESAQEVLNKSTNERSGVLSTAMSFLELYRDPIIAKAVSRSDFCVNDLMFGKNPVSLYLVTPPSDISRTKPLMRLIWNQVARKLTERPITQEAHYDHKLLMLMDEFTSLGRMEFLETALSYIPGYGIKAMLVCQSLNKIDNVYGPHNSIMDACHIRHFFAANDEKTAKRISELTGTKTEQRQQRNFAGSRLAPWLSHLMVASQETARPLRTPGEIMQLPKDQQIIFYAGAPPILAYKILYYQERGLRGRDHQTYPAPLLFEGHYPDCPNSGNIILWDSSDKPTDTQKVDDETPSVMVNPDRSREISHEKSRPLFRTESPNEERYAMQASTDITKQTVLFTIDHDSEDLDRSSRADSTEGIGGREL